MLLLLLFALFINRHIKIKALYGDDLYLWSFYGCEDFWSFTFPQTTKGNFRPFYWAVSYLEFWLIGAHVSWYATFNVLLNAGISWVIYFFSRRLSRLGRSDWNGLLGQGVGLLTGGLYLQSHFAAYQIAQVLGLLESLALLFSILTLWFLYDYMEGLGTRSYALACGSFFLVIFTHERYIALAPLFYLAVLTEHCMTRRVTHRRLPIGKLLAPLLMLGIFFGARMLVAGEALPVGTAGTKVQDTFSLTQALSYAFMQLAYIFGINAGEKLFCGINFLDSARYVQLLVLMSWIPLLLLLLLYIRTVWRKGRISVRLVGENLLFIFFIALCIGASSITIRLETRWVYVSYTAALLYLSYMLGQVRKYRYDVQRDGRAQKAAAENAVGRTAMRRKGQYSRLIFAGGFLLYGLLITPVEHYDRMHYSNIFFFLDLDRMNSLADCTINKDGAENFLGKKQVYIFYNYFEMTDFYAEYFYKPFDPEKSGQGTEIHFISSPAELPAEATEENSVVLLENQNRGYLDVTLQAFGKAAWDDIAQG